MGDNMKFFPIILIGAVVCLISVALIPPAQGADATWEAKKLYEEQWLFFEVGNLDQGTEIEYGIRVTTADESVNLAFMDSTNYAAFSSSMGETFVGQDPQYQVRAREATFTVPYQQQWYFVAFSDQWSTIDIEYYVNIVEDDSDDTLCGGALFAGAIGIIALIGVVSVLNKR